MAAGAGAATTGAGTAAAGSGAAAAGSVAAVGLAAAEPEEPDEDPSDEDPAAEDPLAADPPPPDEDPDPPELDDCDCGGVTGAWSPSAWALCRAGSVVETEAAARTAPELACLVEAFPGAIAATSPAKLALSPAVARISPRRARPSLAMTASRCAMPSRGGSTDVLGFMTATSSHHHQTPVRGP